MTGIRLAVPERAQKGDVIELKALIQHPMESGFRRGSRGEVIPRNIITRFECFYNQELVFASDFNPAIAANPILTFYTRATETGELEFRWTDQNGESWSDRKSITVT
ncbi:MAG: thiosulfate oxidation carrier complex protein SoxZ [Pseudomonadota bacterium]